MDSYNQEGESISYGALLDDFEDDIDVYNKKQKEKSIPRKGVARFV
jgi:hypothetical protein